MISRLLDRYAWAKDMDYLTARVEALNAAEDPPRELLLAAAAALKSVTDAPVDGYRRTRRARHATWRMEGICQL